MVFVVEKWSLFRAEKNHQKIPYTKPRVHTHLLSKTGANKGEHDGIK